MYRPCMFVCGWRYRCIHHACLCVDGGADVSTMHVCVWMAVQMYQPCMFVCGWRCRCIDHACLCVDGGVDVSTMHVCVWMAV